MKNPLGGALGSAVTSGTTSAPRVGSNALSTTLGLSPNLEFGGFTHINS